MAPNPAHRALANQRGLINITQNVDNLLEQAGASVSNVLHLHGTIVKDRCHARCGFEEEIDLQNPPPLRQCPRCDDHMRPAVVWFGENLPSDIWSAAETACRRADCLLVVGTSATVYPAAGLIDLVSMNGGQIIVVNTQADDIYGAGTIQLTGPAGDLMPALLDGLDLNTSQAICR